MAASLRCRLLGIELKNIIFLHGAHSSAISFNHIIKELPDHNSLLVNYTVDTPFIQNEEYITQLATEVFKDEPFDIVGHSMGGLFAARLLNNAPNAERAVTISSPYGGSHFVRYLRFFAPTYQLFKDIKVDSPIIKDFKAYGTKKSLTQIITTGGGNPLLADFNDGTVTISSQKAISAEFIELDLGHFEVLLGEETPEIIKNRLFP